MIKPHLISSVILFCAAVIYTQPLYQLVKVEDEKKVEVIVDEAPVSLGTLEYMTASWCSPCKKMKADKALDAARALGYDVVENSSLGRRYPAFRLTVNGKVKSWTGYSSKSRFISTIKQHTNNSND